MQGDVIVCFKSYEHFLLNAASSKKKKEKSDLEQHEGE